MRCRPGRRASLLGFNVSGEVGPVPEVAGGWIGVSAGKRFGCGVASADRAVRCWGDSSRRCGAWFGPWAAVTAGEAGYARSAATIAPRTVADGVRVRPRPDPPSGPSPSTPSPISAHVRSSSPRTSHSRVGAPTSSAMEASALVPGRFRTGRLHAHAPGGGPDGSPRGAMGRRRRGYTTNVRRSRLPPERSSVGAIALVVDAWRPPRSTNTDSCHARGNSPRAARVRGTWSPSGKTTPAEYSPPRNESRTKSDENQTDPAASNVFTPGDILCWGDGSAGRRAPDGSNGVVLPWQRAWPAARTSGDRVRRFRVSRDPCPRRALRRQTRRDRSATALIGAFVRVAVVLSAAFVAA